MLWAMRTRGVLTLYGKAASIAAFRKIDPATSLMAHCRMDANTLLAPIADDMRAIDALIREELNSDVVLINQLGEHIIGAGGKRLRPALVALAAKALACESPHIVTGAAIIEFIHTATLLHDDVVDESALRRGRETANALWGNAASVLTGDFLYSRAFQMMVRLDSMPVMQLLAETTNAIAEGEVLQLMNIGDPEVTEARYMDVIDRKTARLFGAATQMAAIIAGAEDKTAQALHDYGRALGVAFQLIDDALDYSGSATELGKNVGDDLAEGKPTLPLIQVLKHGTGAAQQRVRNAIENSSAEELSAIVEDVQDCGALDYTVAQAHAARDRAIAALDALPAGPARDHLAALAAFSVSRSA